VNNSDLPGTTAKERYAFFLQTPFWAELSNRARVLSGKCAECESVSGLQAHHKFYRDNWFDTQIDDLRVLCNSCHWSWHKKKKAGKMRFNYTAKTLTKMARRRKKQLKSRMKELKAQLSKESGWSARVQEKRGWLPRL
jgi:hypothetical protein